MTDESWYSVELPRDSAGARLRTEIQILFDKQFMASTAPDEVAMYGTGTLADGEHFCLYFSPGTGTYCADFLRRIEAQPCAKPTDVEAFLVGDRDKMREMLGYEPDGAA